MRQAHFRNMRSKCRCSCVLQFTRHHGVSSVLHRPPSQMIHCIVLCFLILGPKVQSAHDYNIAGGEGLGYRNPTWGDQNLFRGGSSLNCSIDIPRLGREGAKRGTVPQTGPSRHGGRHKIEPPGQRRSSEGRQAPSSEEARPCGAARFPWVFLWVSMSTGTSNR